MSIYVFDDYDPLLDSLIDIAKMSVQSVSTLNKKDVNTCLHSLSEFN